MGGDYYYRALSSAEGACLYNGTGSPEYRAHLEAIQDLGVKSRASLGAFLDWQAYVSSIWANPTVSAAKWAAFEQAAAAHVEAERTARRSGPNAPPNWNAPWSFGIQDANGNWVPAPFDPD